MVPLGLLVLVGTVLPFIIGQLLGQANLDYFKIQNFQDTEKQMMLFIQVLHLAKQSLKITMKKLRLAHSLVFGIYQASKANIHKLTKAREYYFESSQKMYQVSHLIKLPPNKFLWKLLPSIDMRKMTIPSYVQDVLREKERKKVSLTVHAVLSGFVKSRELM